VCPCLQYPLCTNPHRTHPPTPQDDNSWAGIRGDKVHLVRNLAMLAVAGRTEVLGAGGRAQQQQQQRRSDQHRARAGDEEGAAAPLPAMLRIESLRALGARLLRLLVALLDAAEEAGLYSESARQRIRMQGANDRMQLDKALLGVLVGRVDRCGLWGLDGVWILEHGVGPNSSQPPQQPDHHYNPIHPQLGNDVPTPLKHPLTKGELLAVLPGRDRVRLIGLVAAGGLVLVGLFGAVWFAAARCCC